MSGLYVVFEGPECTGKSSQVAMLAERLTKESYEVFITKEPGGDNPLSRQIRQILLNPESKIDARASLCLFLADRSQNALAVKEALAAGKVVISDRSSLSSFVYYAASCFEQNVFDVAKEIAPLLDFAQVVVPDWAFICNNSYEWSQKQLEARGQKDRIEQLGEDFHRRVHKFFEPQFIARLGTHMARAPVKYEFCATTSMFSKETIHEAIFTRLQPDLKEKLHNRAAAN